jgi:thioredoxin reductase (NADPH)
MTTDMTFDLLIIGGGPGGLTAAIYALRGKLSTLLIEKTGIGGQIALTDIIENYPGVDPMSGAELMDKFETQAKSFGLKTESAEVTGIEDAGEYRRIVTTSGEYRAKTVIIASGAKWRKLGAPGEAAYTGRGVSYCATCDGFFFRNKDVVVVGGGDTAVKEALFLAKMVNKVHLVHRRDRLRAEKIHQEQALANPKIECHWDTVVEEISGDKTVTGVKTKNVKTGESGEIRSDGVFVFVGVQPNSEFFAGDKDTQGFIATDRQMATSMEGVFAVGDVRDTPLRQVATAVGDGAVAAFSAQDFIDRQPPRE